MSEDKERPKDLEAIRKRAKENPDLQQIIEETVSEEKAEDKKRTEQGK